MRAGIVRGERPLYEKLYGCRGRFWKMAVIDSPFAR